MIWPIKGGKRHVPPSRSTYGYSGNFPKRRLNMGTDILAKAGSTVLLIEDGVVQKVYEYTNPTLDSIDAYKKSYSIVVQHEDGNYLVYANLTDIKAKPGDLIKKGTPVGKVSRFTRQNTKETMLHIEYWSRLPKKREYWGMKHKPKGLLSSTSYLGKAEEHQATLKSRTKK